MLYIIKKDYFLADYIIDLLCERTDITIIKYSRNKCSGLKKIKHLITRFIRAFIFNHKGLWNQTFFTERFLQQLKSINKDDKVLFWGCENLKELLVLDKEIVCKEKSVFLWNPVSTICRNVYSKWEYSHYLNKSGMHIYTFDENDATRYKFNKINQVYRFPHNSYYTNITNIDYEVFFIGKDKSRSTIIAQLARQLTEQGISFKFHIIRDKHTLPIKQLEQYYNDKEMSYADSLKKVMRTKCIIEIMQQGQSGMTLRTLEAIFLRKKLITTNKNIVQTPIYNPNNIYILNYEQNKFSNIKEFLNCEYQNIPEDIIRQYDVKSWIKRFL